MVNGLRSKIHGSGLQFLVLRYKIQDYGLWGLGLKGLGFWI